MPAVMNRITMERITPLPIAPITWFILSAGIPERHKCSKPMTAPKPHTNRITGHRSRLIRCTTETMIIPDMKAMKVAIRVGRKMSAALKLVKCCSIAIVCRMAMTEVGTSVSPAVLSTRNMICASLAVSFTGFSSCSSPIALRPSGVAALSSPSMVAERFMVTLPLAGWSLGTSLSSMRNKGETALESTRITPAFSPIFIIPSHNVITPVRPMDISKPFFAASNRALSISDSRPVCPKAKALMIATTKPMIKNATHT